MLVIYPSELGMAIERSGPTDVNKILSIAKVAAHVCAVEGLVIIFRTMPVRPAGNVKMPP